ncbi:50S ribosomal protein L21e [Candidatus Woesearchaeota archaeon]|jgi:ribosomal protein L21E|nr:50S ribosomal protein L21e [Candidatus Woesearchaeota archaeon]MBT4388025.1 50S ribosomal protein L21e [Candidatus Woesearchaeota archaeon]MBT4596290.1 50S ribosomal protein L21e [Candidatus Woesearchaeota archaeon]MBT5740792.1 50S ribosomal protein L21e [Candidatus Woesearchaeota archaeon]MBT6505574.1 50S ribosomal protein L21e [Candidatus Woesearchaeota archaeon]
MVKRVGGLRRKTRHLLRNDVKSRGKLSLVKFFQKFNDGDKVILKLQPNCQNGMFHRRYQGNVATVSGTQGSCYTVKLPYLGKEKELIVHPIHLFLQN